MIKQLINDITFDNIDLSQALTRSKFVVSKVDNTPFKSWLKKELEGYDFSDESLPKYRKIFSLISLTAEFPFNHFHTFPVSVNDDQLDEILKYHKVIEPISIIEQQIAVFNSQKGYLELQPKLVEPISKLYSDELGKYRGVVRKGQREVNKAQYQNIIELTKQRLLDTLMELDNELPNLLKYYKITEENKIKVQNIITTNIYGGTNPLNIAAGKDVKQEVNSISITVDGADKLKEYGVLESDIEKLNKLISDNKNNNSNLISKTMDWLKSVGASVTARGFYENIPAITDFLKNIGL